MMKKELKRKKLFSPQLWNHWKIWLWKMRGKKWNENLLKALEIDFWKRSCAVLKLEHVRNEETKEEDPEDYEGRKMGNYGCWDAWNSDSRKYPYI